LIYRRRSEVFHGSCLDLVTFPMRALILFRLSTFFVWLIPFSRNRQSRLLVLMHSSNHYLKVTAIHSGSKPS
jgi:hypothetical protein